MSTTTIGNTPLRSNGFLSRKFGCRVYVKEEFHNPNKSAKDRPACYLVRDAIRRKKIPPGGTFVEASSGNTGIAIAWMAKNHGYRSRIFVSKNCSTEKLDVLRSHGADIIICDNSNGLQDPTSTQFRAKEYARTNSNSYFTNQYENPVNALSHYETTGPEIWEQSGGQVTHVFVGVGTGGTVSGIGKFLKEKKKGVHVIGVEPKGSVLSDYLKYGFVVDNGVPMDKIEGIGRKFVPGVFDPAVVDWIDQVSKDDTVRCARAYEQATKHLLGFSSAAVLYSFCRYLRQHPPRPEDFYVLLFPDYGDRYRKVLYSYLDDVKA